MIKNFETTEEFVKRAEIINEGGTVVVTDKATGGSIGLAPVTVDVADVIHINQTTAGQTLTLPVPTANTVDTRVTVIGVGTAAFTIYGKVIGVGGAEDFVYNSALASPAWVSVSSSSTSVVTSGGVTSSSATAGIGYATGAGGAITQLTSRTTGVTLNTVSGQITTNNASLAAEAAAEFTVTNSTVALGDVVVVSQQSGSNGGDTNVYTSGTAAGSFKIKVANNNASGGTAETGAIIINYAVVKAVAA